MGNNMKNFIKSLKMIRYGLQVKTMTILTLAFFAFGIVFEFTMSKSDGTNITSGLYMAIAGVYAYQVIVSSSVSSLVQTSSMKHGLQTTYPTLFTLITSLFTFTTFVIIRVCRINSLGGKDFDEFTLSSAKGILTCAFLVMICAVYMGISYKSFIFSLVILSLGVIAVMFSSTFGRFSSLLDFANNWSMATIIIVSYCMVLVGWVLCWLISNLLYRKSIDTLSVRAALRQAAMK